jgi:magnesium-transporting ATPase (P-type)
MNEEKIISRVRKMLALAADERASDGERDNAMRMAHNLLAKHNLTLAQASDTPEEARDRIVFVDRNDPWARQVAYGIAQLFFCKYYFIGYTDKTLCHHFFIGKESNAVTAQLVAEHAIKSVRKEAAAYVRDGGPGTPRDFCKGATARIYQRCTELRRAAEAESAAAPTQTSTGTALVLASLYKTEENANDAFLAQLGLNLREGKSRERSVSSITALRAGAAYGDKVHLGRSIGTDARSDRVALAA